MILTAITATALIATATALITTATRRHKHNTETKFIEGVKQRG